jgi:hypothetical protein
MDQIRDIVRAMLREYDRAAPNMPDVAVIQAFMARLSAEVAKLDPQAPAEPDPAPAE